MIKLVVNASTAARTGWSPTGLIYGDMASWFADATGGPGDVRPPTKSDAMVSEISGAIQSISAYEREDKRITRVGLLEDSAGEPCFADS